MATNWENANQRQYLYAGKKKGATVAAWKQGFRAESAATAMYKTGYAEALLDLIKVFDNVPHWLLVQEGIRLGYPLWMVPAVNCDVQNDESHPH